MIRRAIKQMLAGMIYYTGLGKLLGGVRAGDKRRPLILMYHSVLPADDPRRQFIQPGLIITPEQFERQMEYLAARYQPTALENLFIDEPKDSQLSPTPFVVTFDDGWRDNYEFAMPILARLKIPATVFLATNFMGTSDPFWFVQAKHIWNCLKQNELIRIIQASNIESIEKGELSSQTASFDIFAEFIKRLDPSTATELIEYLTKALPEALPKRDWVINWSEAKEMMTHGICFGSHGQSHTVLTQLNQASVERELAESKELIESKLELKVDLLAYPNGNCNAEIKEQAKAAGYRLALIASSPSGADPFDPMALPRVSIHEGVSMGVASGFSKALFACHIDHLL